MRKRMQNKGHNHVKEMRAFSKGRTRSELTITPIGWMLTKNKNKLIFRHSLKIIIVGAVRMRYPRDIEHNIISGVTTIRVPRTLVTKRGSG